MPDLNDVRAPTLVVRGEADGWVSREVADRLVANIPNARLARIAGVGRLVSEEDPEWLCEQLFQFIGEHLTPHVAL